MSHIDEVNKAVEIATSQLPRSPIAEGKEATSTGFQKAQAHHIRYDNAVSSIVYSLYPFAKIDERIVAEYMLADLTPEACAEAVIKTIKRKL